MADRKKDGKYAAYEADVEQRRKKLIFLIKCTVVPFAVAMVVLAVFLIADVSGLGKKIVLEAGNSLPPASEVYGKSGAVYQYNEDEIDITVPGEYTIYIVYGDSKTKVKLVVRDTTPPQGNVIELNVHDGGVLPEAKDFFDNIVEASDYTAKFVGLTKISGVGTYDITIQLTDKYSNKSTYRTKMNVIIDTVPPTITAPAQIVGYVGQGIAYRDGVSVTDNCFGVELNVDSSGVRNDVEGEYKVKYTARDAAGNTTVIEVPVFIHKVQITKEKLMNEIAKIASEQGMKSSMTKEELCKKIYGYVNDPAHDKDNARFKYVGSSNDSTRSDWMYEAYYALQNGQGDCYSYMALSKAFFEYFGIENKDIQRSEPVNGETHFWCMVNIDDTGNSPRWYFFDATRFAGKFTLGGNNGCLITMEQLYSYKPSSNKFTAETYYAFENSKYPAVQTKIVNTNYVW